MSSILHSFASQRYIHLSLCVVTTLPLNHQDNILVVVVARRHGDARGPVKTADILAEDKELIPEDRIADARVEDTRLENPRDEDTRVDHLVTVSEEHDVHEDATDDHKRTIAVEHMHDDRTGEQMTGEDQDEAEADDHDVVEHEERQPVPTHRR